MRLEQLSIIDAIKQFLEGTQAVAFSVAIDKKEKSGSFHATFFSA